MNIQQQRIEEFTEGSIRLDKEKQKAIRIPTPENSKTLFSKDYRNALNFFNSLKIDFDSILREDTPVSSKFNFNSSLIVNVKNAQLFNNKSQRKRTLRRILELYFISNLPL